MKQIPCDGCISLPICKAESYNYDTKKYRINPIIISRCPYIIEESVENINFIKIRYFLRPDLKNETNPM